MLRDEYLSLEELEHMHQVLTQQLRDILERSRSTVTELTEVRDQPPDEVDMASEETDQELTLRQSDRERKLVSKIQKALERMNSGEYGVCEVCGGPVGFQRLMVRPVATFCIDCKTQAEQLEPSRRASF